MNSSITYTCLTILFCFIVFQEVLVWVTRMLKDVGDDPSDEKVKEYVLKTLDSGVGVTSVSVALGIYSVRPTGDCFGHCILKKLA